MKKRILSLIFFVNIILIPNQANAIDYELIGKIALGVLAERITKLAINITCCDEKNQCIPECAPKVALTLILPVIFSIISWRLVNPGPGDFV